MKYRSVFDIIGPVMVGPSSSHTAGAVRIGLFTRHIFGMEPEKIKITLYGSFKETYKGHGTDIALIGGLLGYDTSDKRIRTSMEDAKEKGIDFEFIESEMQKGISFAVAIDQLKLFQQPLILLIVQGELTHQLDIKLRQFSKNSFEDFKGTLEKKIMLVQPVLFVGIGLMIMSMYIILMLPTLTMIGGN